MKGGINGNGSSESIGVDSISSKIVLGNVDGSKISKQRGRRSYRPVDLKAKQGLDESTGSAQENDQNNDTSVSNGNGSVMIPQVDDKERFTKLMQDHVRVFCLEEKLICLKDKETQPIPTNNCVP